MDTPHHNIGIVMGRLVIHVALVGYGWVVGGIAGLLVMLYVTLFLVFAATTIAFGGWFYGLWIAIKWFGFFLLLNFITFLVSAQIAEDMLVFIGHTFILVENLVGGISNQVFFIFFTVITMISLVSYVCKK